MNLIVITVCALFILLGFEIRHRQVIETLLELKKEKRARLK